MARLTLSRWRREDGPERRCQALRVFELRQWARFALIAHAFTDIDEEIANQVGLGFELFEINFVRFAKHFPIDITKIVARRVFAMFGEFDRLPSIGAAVHPREIPINDVPGAQFKTSELRERAGIEIGWGGLHFLE